MLAGDLHVGEPVSTLDGQTAVVAWVHTVPGQADYYNLTVADDHTYAVGDGQYVVHNCAKIGGAEGGDEPYIEFAHGTSLENAQLIKETGLDEGAARAESKGGLYSRPGSFHTYNFTEFGGKATQEAYEMGLHQSDQPVVLISRLPQSVYEDLLTAGLVHVEPLPGIDIPQTVFEPGAFGRFNESVEWGPIVDPYKRI